MENKEEIITKQEDEIKKLAKLNSDQGNTIRFNMMELGQMKREMQTEIEKLNETL